MTLVLIAFELEMIVMYPWAVVYVSVASRRSSRW
jgi:NADH:ubiquinone oxidoreductase subunit 3 (subunit A)